MLSFCHRKGGRSFDPQFLFLIYFKTYLLVKMGQQKVKSKNHNAKNPNILFSSIFRARVTIFPP